MDLDKEKILFLLKENMSLIKDKFNVKHISLFGSYAKGNYSEKSDIDFLVEYEDKFENDISNELDLQVFLYNLFKKDIGLCEKNRVNKDILREILKSNIVEIC